MGTALINAGPALAVAAVLFALAGAFWLARPLGRDWPNDETARKELHRRCGQVSMLAALAVYFAAGLGVTVTYQKGGWGADESYLRMHILDGFGCVAFFAAAWSQLEDRHTLARATMLLTVATAGTAAAAAFVAEGSLLDVALMAVMGVVYGWSVWGYITYRLRRAAAKRSDTDRYGLAIQTSISQLRFKRVVPVGTPGAPEPGTGTG